MKLKRRKWLELIENARQRKLREHQYVDYTKYLKEEEE